MSEQNEMSCDEFADVAAELALGVLTGRERAQAVAHLDECDSCREHVRQLSLTGEELLGLLPSQEPPEGFESRVMAGLGMATRRPKRWSRRMLAMAAVARHWSTVLNGMQVDLDGFKRDTDRVLDVAAEKATAASRAH